jgi:hypothetical protein
VFGKANGSVVNLSDITSASNPTGGFVVNGEAANNYSGGSVSSAGDVNGDGLDDLIGTHNQIIQAITVDIACAGD